MSEVPSLFVLCLDSIKNEILSGDDDISYIYELPSDLFDCLLPRLPALALQKLQDGLPLNCGDEHEVASEIRESVKGVGNYEFENDWQQMYWEIHLQSCLAAAAEKAVLPYFEGCLGEIKIPAFIEEQ